MLMDTAWAAWTASRAAVPFTVQALFQGIRSHRQLFRLSTIRLAVIRRMPLLWSHGGCPTTKQQQLLLDNSHPGRNLHTLAGTPDAKASLSLIRRSIRSPTEMALPSTVRVC
ncbi:hypothetical protein E4U26_002698 [Claviceps purpurea]|nr:hypothetical protein E4U26_002698 [Claviceps purpurea]